MLWFFERDDQSLRLQTRYDNESAEIVVTVHWPDGREQVERFTEPAACRTWLLTLERTLEEQQWIRNGPPIVLPYGWPKKRLS
jgi:hypothetical protein